jgi:hypothetical protein
LLHVVQTSEIKGTAPINLREDFGMNKSREIIAEAKPFVYLIKFLLRNNSMISGIIARIINDLRASIALVCNLMLC